MNVVEQIRKRFKVGYIGVTDESVLYEQMLDDINFLLILFDARNKAIENRIKDLETEISNEYSIYSEASCRFRIDELKNLLINV